MATFAASGYEDRRLRKMADWAGGASVLDIGYAQMPNPYLDPKVTVGFDRDRPKSLPYAEHISGDATHLRDVFPDRRFDCILAGELIEHLECPYDFLRTVRELLAPSGQLILSTPNPIAFPTIFFEWMSSHRHFYSSDHTYYFTPRWVQRMLRSTGYDIVAMQGVGFWPTRWAPAPVCLSYQVIYVAEVSRPVSE